MPDASASRGPSLVFLYGALRSGTTLLRLMLKAHPDIDSPGEVDFLFDYLKPSPDHPTGWRYDRQALLDDRIFLSKNVVLPDDLDGLDLLESMLDQMRARQLQRVMVLNVHRNADRIVTVVPGARFVHLLRDPRDVARSAIGMGWAGTLYKGVDVWLAAEGNWNAAVGPAGCLAGIAVAIAVKPS